MAKNLYSLNYGSFVGLRKGYRGLRNKWRLKTFTKIISPERNDKILEIGCNDGVLLSHISQFTNEVYGIDTNEEMVKKLNNNKIQTMSATDLKFDNEYFDKVYAFEVIEHIPEIKKVFLEVYRVLKPPGRFIFSFPFEFIRGETALIDAIAIYKNPFYARKLHIHKLSPQKIKELIHDIPFDIIKSFIKFIFSPSYIMILQKV